MNQEVPANMEKVEGEGGKGRGGKVYNDIIQYCERTRLQIHQFFLRNLQKG